MYHDLLVSSLDLPAVDRFLSRIELYATTKGRAFLCQCEFHVMKSGVAEELNIAIPESISKSVQNRQAEFIAGRYMAKLCLEALSVVDFEIGIGPHREPLWPDKLTGAISHTSNRGIALVAERTSYQFVGIDTEDWLDAETVEQIWLDIHNEGELTLFREQGVSFDIATSIIFSAKESLFKAVFPYVGCYFGFEKARVISFNQNEQSLVLVLDSSISKHGLAQRIFKSRYFMNESGVTTVILS
ncbi:4'-phosphopantetheinyl transferase family protein [Vibrio atlanticus]|uniref:4'-phosphopantetheinyl transferase family protein n=1 Tax=Vibrio atlanticus TaxID=693153 RepID=UPI00354BBC04